MSDISTQQLGAVQQGGSAILAALQMLGPVNLDPAGMLGTATNDNAPAGAIGEYMMATVASGSAVSLSSGASKDVTSLTLTPGDWDVSGQVDFTLAGVTGTVFQMGLSEASNTLPVQTAGVFLGPDGLVNMPIVATLLSGSWSQGIGPIRASIASGANKPVYLEARSVLSIGTISAFGTIRARRMR